MDEKQRIVLRQECRNMRDCGCKISLIMMNSSEYVCRYVLCCFGVHCEMNQSPLEKLKH